MATRKPGEKAKPPPQSPTGRPTSRHPNIQNIPIRTAEGEAVRQALIAELRRRGHTP